MTKICKNNHTYSIEKNRCPDCIRIWKSENKESIKKYMEQYRQKNQQKLIISKKKWRDDNKENIKKYIKDYRDKNKDKINISIKNRKNKDCLFYLIRKTRTLISTYFKRNGYKKDSKNQEIVGCSFRELQIHLKNTAIKNYGNYDSNEKYHIDHIIPISIGSNYEEIKLLNHYTNLQYLKPEDNIKKSNKLIINEKEVKCNDEIIKIKQEFIESIKTIKVI